MTDLQVVSLFAGIGGIDRGLELAGAKTVLQCEIDTHARTILARHYPDAAIHNDVTELTADDCRAAGAVPERTILTAGFPCQDLSVAGRRRGMGEGTRSGLYWHVDRLLGDFRPAWVILENVPGLLSAGCPCPGDGTCADTCPGELHSVPGGACDGGCIAVHGGTMGAVLGSLAERGYGFAYRVLDARYFGVPQRRRRVVIVGRLGDTGAAAAQVLLEPEGMRRDPAPLHQPQTQLATHARESTAEHRWIGQQYAATLTSGSHSPNTGAPGRRHEHTLTAEGSDASEDGTGRGTPIVAFSHTAGIDIQSSELVPPTLKTETNLSVVYVADRTTSLRAARGGPDDNDARGGHLVAFALRGREEGALPEVHADGSTVGALRSAAGGSSRDYIAADTVVRRLSPMECERLQGYPDNWTEGQADTQRYKQMGNSVAVPVFEWVGRRLIAVDEAAA